MGHYDKEKTNQSGSGSSSQAQICEPQQAPLAHQVHIDTCTSLPASQSPPTSDYLQPINLYLTGFQALVQL